MSAAPEPEGGGLGRFDGVLAAVEQAASEILAEAEREASRRIEQADERVERLAQERARELAGASEELLEKAKRIRAQAEVLLSMLDQEIAALGTPASRAAYEPQQATAPGAETAPAPEPSPERRAAPAAFQSSHETPRRAAPQAAEDDPLVGLRERLSALSRPPEPVPLDKQRNEESGEESRPRFGRERRSGPAAPASEGAILLATQMAVAGATPAQIETRLRNDFGIDDPSAILDQLAG